MAEELINNSLEYTPTWIVAVVCSIIVFISLCVERALHRLGKYLVRKKQAALYQALQKLKDELMLLGFISLLLTVSQGLISHICIPPKLATYMLPCKRSHGSSKGSEHDQIYSDNTINRRRLFSAETGSEHCSQRIRQWKRWEDDIGSKISRSKDSLDASRIQAAHHHEFFKKHAFGYWRRSAVVGWLISFFKQFYGSVTESDYIAMRLGFINEHCPGYPRFDFHKYMLRTLEVDFKKIVGISWYLWLFVVLFLLLDLEGWHTYFWLAFLPLILLLLVGAKLEHIIARLAQESQKSVEELPTKLAVEESVRGRKEKDAAQVKPSDQYFWFSRPTLVLDLLHFILFQNSFEIAFFFWIWSTYGFDSCIMEKIAYIIPRLIMGLIVQVLCSYSTLPLYAIVTQMGSRFKKGIFADTVESFVLNWADSNRARQTMAHNMVRESTQQVQTDEQAIITMEGATTSTIELPRNVQAPLQGT